jgi:hypothetical protein
MWETNQSVVKNLRMVLEKSTGRRPVGNLAQSHSGLRIRAAEKVPSQLPAQTALVAKKAAVRKVERRNDGGRQSAFAPRDCD